MFKKIYNYIVLAWHYICKAFNFISNKIASAGNWVANKFDRLSRHFIGAGPFFAFLIVGLLVFGAVWLSATNDYSREINRTVKVAGWNVDSTGSIVPDTFKLTSMQGYLQNVFTAPYPVVDSTKTDKANEPVQLYLDGEVYRAVMNTVKDPNDIKKIVSMYNITMTTKEKYNRKKVLTKKL